MIIHQMIQMIFSIKPKFSWKKWKAIHTKIYLDTICNCMNVTTYDSKKITSSQNIRFKMIKH